MSKVSFRHLSFQDVGPFRGKYELEFSPGLNLITGSNGSGKTTVFYVLKAALGLPFSKREAEYFSGMQRQAVSPLTSAASFSAELDGTVPENSKWKALVALHCESIFDEEYLRQLFETAAEKDVDELCYHFNKYVVPIFFKWNLSADGDIQCHFFRNGSISFSVNGLSNERLTQDLWTHAAMGERTMTAYGLFMSIREASHHSGPLVLDSPFGVLDDMFRGALANWLSALLCQVILVDSPFSMASLFAGQPGYLLSYLEAEGRSTISRVEDMVSVDYLR